MRRHDFPSTAKLEADGYINLGARSEQDVEGRRESLGRQVEGQTGREQRRERTWMEGRQSEGSSVIIEA